MDHSTSSDPLLIQLKDLTQDLFWCSEIDATFTVLQLGETAPDHSPVDLLKLPADKTVKTRTLESFFRNAIKPQDWHGPQEQAEVQIYQTLVSTLEAQLKDLQVYEVGEIEVDIYILGRTPGNQVIGLSTQAVMT